MLESGSPEDQNFGALFAIVSGLSVGSLAIGCGSLEAAGALLEVASLVFEGFFVVEESVLAGELPREMYLKV